MMQHSSGSTFHNRYPYSTKIICGEHGTTFHRQVLESAGGSREVWQCKVYRQRGRAACAAPQIRSSDVDMLLGAIFKELLTDKEAIINSLVAVLTHIPGKVDYEKVCSRLERGIEAVNAKKDHLLDLSAAGALTVEEFRQRNEALNTKLRAFEEQLEEIRAEEAKNGAEDLDIAQICRALDRELSFEGTVNTALAASILEKIVVKKGSTKKQIHLDIYLKLGQRYEAVYAPQKTSASIIRLKNTMPRHQTRRI